MNIKDLSLWEAFYSVAKEENFTKAATKLKIGTPLLSKRIAKLESQLGIKLFNRTTRKVKCTIEAESLIPQLKTIIEDLEGLEDRYSRKDTVVGTIRISAINAFAHRVLAPHLKQFAEIYPKVKFEILATDDLLDLIDHQIDIAFRVQEPSGSDFIYKKLFENKLILCASPKYLKNTTPEIKTIHDLKKHRLLLLKVYEDCHFIKSQIKISDLGLEQNIFCENGLFLTEMAKIGAGIALRSRWDVDPLIQSGELVQVLPNQPISSFGTMYCVIPTRRLLSFRVRTFLDFISKQLA